MKKTILPALAMLIVAAVMLSTASYAWFAMSDEVSATSMNVSVTSDAANLIISTNKNQVTNATTYNALTVGIATDPATKLLPVTFDDEDLTATSLAGPSDNGEEETIWYYMTSNAASTSTGDPNTLTHVKGKDFSKYVLVNTVYVGVSQGSNEMTNLQAKVTIDGTTNIEADAENYINVLIVATDSTTGFQRFTKTTANYNNAVSLADSITADSPVQIDIYIFYNGEHGGITSQNLAGDAIKNATISVFFHADQASN